MKREELLKILRKKGCIFLREGGNHSLFFNPANEQISTVPRHREINDFLVKKICKDLGVTRK